MRFDRDDILLFLGDLLHNLIFWSFVIIGLISIILVTYDILKSIKKLII